MVRLSRHVHDQTTISVTADSLMHDWSHDWRTPCPRLSVTTVRYHGDGTAPQWQCGITVRYLSLYIRSFWRVNLSSQQCSAITAMRSVFFVFNVRVFCCVDERRRLACVCVCVWAAVAVVHIEVSYKRSSVERRNVFTFVGFLSICLSVFHDYSKARGRMFEICWGVELRKRKDRLNFETDPMTDTDPHRRYFSKLRYGIFDISWQIRILLPDWTDSGRIFKFLVSM